MNQIDNINCFSRMAKRGGHSGASSGERVAHRLAVALHAIGDDMALLDAESINGFNELCLLAHGPWPTDKLKTLVFTTIASAAK